jgi:hypothetical protein
VGHMNTTLELSIARIATQLLLSNVMQPLNSQVAAWHVRPTHTRRLISYWRLRVARQQLLGVHRTASIR